MSVRILRPRCLEPMTFIEKNEPRDDFAPVCWKRKGHNPPHASRWAYERDCEHRNEMKRRAARIERILKAIYGERYEPPARRAREMSQGAATVSA